MFEKRIDELTNVLQEARDQNTVLQQGVGSHDHEQGDVMYQFSLSEARVHQLQDVIGRRDIDFAALYQAERRNAQELTILRAVLATRDAVLPLSGGSASTLPVLQQTREVKPPFVISGGFASAPPLPKFTAKSGLAQTFQPSLRIEEEQPMFEEDFPTGLTRPVGFFPGKPGGQSDRSTGESDISSNLSVSAVPTWGSGPGRPLPGRPYVPPLDMPLHSSGRPFGAGLAYAGSSSDQGPHASGGLASTEWPRSEFPLLAHRPIAATRTQTMATTTVKQETQEQEAPPPPTGASQGASGSGGHASRHFPEGDGDDDGDDGGDRRKAGEKKKNNHKKSKRCKRGDDDGDGDSDTSSSSSGQSEVSRNRERSRRREGESIKFPALPNVAGFQAWQQAVEDGIIACSVLKEETVYDWLQRGQGVLNEAGFDALGKFPSKFDSLDSKISAGLAIIMKGELGRLIHERNEREKTKNRRRLKGYNVSG